MNETTKQASEAFREWVKKIKSYEEAVGVLYWDMRTGAPRKGMEARSEVVGMLSTEMFKMTVSERMGELLAELSAPGSFEQLDPVTKKLVTECKKDYDRNQKIPPELYQEYVVLTSQAESIWEDAKAKSDFPMFRPYLEKIVEYNKQFIGLWGYEGHKYNTLLDMFEPELTVARLDEVFGYLREKLVPLVAAIQQSANKPDTGFLHQPFDKEKQRKFSLFILEQMGYDFAAGRLDESVHPFATGLNPGDVRITTKFEPNDISFSLFSSIHEGGHALYEQNISADLIGTLLCTGTSMGIHESQSRFWENMVGRSRAFWSRYYGDLQQAFPGQFDHVPLDSFYSAINEVKPSFIRTEADELTYNLHVMIRYEIEKGLFSDSIRVADLPAIWNDKYKEYLGIVPESDAEGVLQDVHWAGGGFGYFPSYSLGNMYAAQIKHTIHKELPDYDAWIREGRLLPIKQWLSERIYRHGKLLTPAEVIEHVTGEALNPSYLVDYLETKYKEIYRF